MARPLRSLFIMIVAVFSISCFLAKANDDDLKKIDSIFNESDCRLQGGQCVIEKDCPEGLLTATKGLCPKQRSKNVECCYGISVKETRCKSVSGDCIPARDCGNAPRFTEATDCQQGEVCCWYE